MSYLCFPCTVCVYVYSCNDSQFYVSANLLNCVSCRDLIKSQQTDDFPEPGLLITQLYHVTTEIKTTRPLSVWTKKQWQTFILHIILLSSVWFPRGQDRKQRWNLLHLRLSWTIVQSTPIFLQSSYETEVLDSVTSMLCLTRKPWLSSSPWTTRRSISGQSHRSKMPPWGL